MEGQDNLQNTKVETVFPQKLIFTLTLGLNLHHNRQPSEALKYNRQKLERINRQPSKAEQT